ncbi:hypothetical protein KIN20_016383 [Parelaphostrongylus tenuis]|uniref:Uncharacterized protein n=1 Tax=Parelaphostrongylus tenuis TaxID=148309 RepID=A0AAD5QQQ0_PARTN|nr:hypothetical protein KIN20_016383 [Parelaphostrongylus tenuis]
MLAQVCSMYFSRDGSKPNHFHNSRGQYYLDRKSAEVSSSKKLDAAVIFVSGDGSGPILRQRKIAVGLIQADYVGYQRFQLAPASSRGVLEPWTT